MGCKPIASSNGSGNRDGGGPDGPNDGGVGDGGVPDASPLAPPACANTLSGSSPFGVRLSGSATLTITSPPGGSTSRNLAVDVYFPHGRQAGAPVILANQVRWDKPGVAAQSAILDGDLGATVTWWGKAGLNGMEDVRIDGRLFGAADGIAADANVNVGDPGSDAGKEGKGRVRLCPNGAVPVPELVPQGSYGPRSTVLLAPTTPPDTTTVHVAVSEGATGIPVSVVASGPPIEVTAATAFPPNQALVFDIGGMKDVLGRAFVLTAQPTPLLTTATVTDLTFATAPPDGSIATTVQFTTNGKLGLNVSATNGPYEVLVALPDPGAATGLAAQLAWQSYYACAGVELAVVGADGAVETYQHQLESEPMPLAASVKLPASRPLWLSVKVLAPPAIPQRLAVGGCTLTLSSLAFQ